MASAHRTILRGELDLTQGNLLFTRQVYSDQTPTEPPVPWRCDHLRQWYALYPQQHPELGTGYRIDLQTPLVRTGRSYECYDLVLDLFVDGQEQYHLLHEEEFAVAKECGWLHHRMAEQAWLQVADWVTLIKSGSFNQWLVELRRMTRKAST